MHRWYRAGKGKGTPALRRGIHCIGIDVEDESEHSDWQGFDWYTRCHCPEWSNVQRWELLRPFVRLTSEARTWWLITAPNVTNIVLFVCRTAAYRMCDMDV